jgi:hypothetical protein
MLPRVTVTKQLVSVLIYCTDIVTKLIIEQTILVKELVHVELNL